MSDSPPPSSSPSNSSVSGKTCTDPNGLVHDMMGLTYTTCGWKRVWGPVEWPIDTVEKHVSCLECIAYATR